MFSLFISESNIRPSMVTHTRIECSVINPSKVHTHSSEHTHSVNTHTPVGSQSCDTRGAVGGFSVLLSRGIEDEESAVHSPPHLQFLPDLRLEPATFGLRVRLSNH